MANRKRLYSINSSLGRGGSVEMDRQNSVQERVSYNMHVEKLEDVGVLEDRASLLYIQTSEQVCLALRRAAQRIRASIRKSDTVFLSDKSCAILLPETPLVGAQAVARRIYSLLVGVEYDLQVLYGSSAYILLRQLQGSHTVISQKDIPSMETSPVIKRQNTNHVWEDEPLPYLAFLTSYPSQRLLHIFPYELADRYHCIPVGAERGVLTLATCQKLQQETVVHLREVLQRDIFQVRCEATMIDDVLRHWQHSAAV